jgi:hypothetical protein
MGYTGQSTIDATVTITNISIFEVASKTITVQTPEITLYGLKENPYLIGDALIVNQKLPIDGTAMSDPHVIFSNNVITLDSTGIYNCSAIIEFEKETSGSTISGSNAFTFTVPYSSQDMEMTYTIDLANDLNTVNLNWQVSNCSGLYIFLNRLPAGLKARIKYIQFTEILK